MKLRSRLVTLKYKGMSNEEVFKKIYKEKVWTPDNQKNFKYYSGLGSPKVLAKNILK